MTDKKKHRQITVVTGTRADYGLLKPVLAAIQGQDQLDLAVVVTGMHLLRRFGYTLREVLADGWPMGGRVKLQTEADDTLAQSQGLGRAITALTNRFASLNTDIVLVLGDRIEAFAAAAAATASQLVLAHIHGGEAAQGVQDDAYRHAISKLAHLHCVASTGAKRRLIRMGEAPWRVYRTGSPGLDNLVNLASCDIGTLCQWTGFDVRDPFVMVLQHPAGGSPRQERQWMEQTLRGCGRAGLKVVVLGSNSDTGFSGIAHATEQLCTQRHWPTLVHVPREVYLGLLRHAVALVGNSSSGIIEAGYLGVDVINVGPRQNGRERGRNVIDVPYGCKPVAEALQQLVKRAAHTKAKPRRSRCKIYGDGAASARIATILAQTLLDQRLRHKQTFH